MTQLVQDQLPTTPARPPRSVRRTSHIDMVFADDGLVLQGAARDLATDERGNASQLASAEVRAELDQARRLRSLHVSPDATGLATIEGLVVGPGFRASVDVAVPDHRMGATPLYLLLDELPVAALISGYSMLYTGAVDSSAAETSVKADICAGWRSDGTMMVSVRRGDGVPVPLGPEAARLERDDDPLSWHELGELPAGAMRRRRLVEVGAGHPPRVWAMFSDTHVNEDGVETVLHQYEVDGLVDTDHGVLTDCVATARVLPWSECPAAAASARRLQHLPLADIRDHVRTDLRGTSTCTHLNDLLRSLGDIPALLAQLAEAT